MECVGARLDLPADRTPGRLADLRGADRAHRPARAVVRDRPDRLAARHRRAPLDGRALAALRRAATRAAGSRGSASSSTAGVAQRALDPSEHPLRRAVHGHACRVRSARQTPRSRSTPPPSPTARTPIQASVTDAAGNETRSDPVTVTTRNGSRPNGRGASRFVKLSAWLRSRRTGAARLGRRAVRLRADRGGAADRLGGRADRRGGARREQPRPAARGAKRRLAGTRDDQRGRAVRLPVARGPEPDAAVRVQGLLARPRAGLERRRQPRRPRRPPAPAHARAASATASASASAGASRAARPARAPA